MYKENKLGIQIFINLDSILANRPNNYIGSKITEISGRKISFRYINNNKYGFKFVWI
jgi:hypothetical protein